MLRPRVIPCLLIREGGLVKTVQFDSGKYVGDPLNTVRIFNEKEVDELVVLDIDATAKGQEPNLVLIEKLAKECRMPLAYGGGISTCRMAQDIISLGVEKVILGSAAVKNPELISEISTKIGKQSTTVVMDVKLKGLFKKYLVTTNNGTNVTKLSPGEFAKQVEELGAGEVIVNSIDRDGTMQGYDTTLIKEVWNSVSIPITALGGASSTADISQLFHEFGIIGAAAGSIFVFKGKYKAVLIQYPSMEEKFELIGMKAVA